MAEFVNIKVTSKHADGTIGFSDDWVVSNAMPGSTSYWASQAGDGDTVETDVIEISASVDERNWNKTEQTMPGDLYTFDNVSVTPRQYGGLTAKGEITLSEDYSVGTSGSKQPMLVCILKNADGKIVTGFNGYLQGGLTIGVPTVFDIDSYFDVTDYTSAEMYANLWI